MSNQSQVPITKFKDINELNYDNFDENYRLIQPEIKDDQANQSIENINAIKLRQAIQDYKLSQQTILTQLIQLITFILPPLFVSLLFYHQLYSFTFPQLKTRFQELTYENNVNSQHYDQFNGTQTINTLALLPFQSTEVQNLSNCAQTYFGMVVILDILFGLVVALQAISITFTIFSVTKHDHKTGTISIMVFSLMYNSLLLLMAGMFEFNETGYQNLCRIDLGNWKQWVWALMILCVVRIVFNSVWMSQLFMSIKISSYMDSVNDNLNSSLRFFRDN